MRALIIPASQVSPIQVKDVTGGQKELQELVGGDFQVVGLGSLGATMYLDSEGKLKPGVLPNSRATEVFNRFIGPGNIILGDVVLLGPADGEGNDTSLPEKTVSMLEFVFGPAIR